MDKEEQWPASYFFKRISQSLFNILQAELDRFHITTAQVFVLLCLSSEDGQLQHQLLKHLNIKPPSLTSLLDQLEKKKLIERRPDPKDGRTKRIYLSAAGTRFLKEDLDPIFHQLEEKLLFDFNKVERRQLFSFLIRLFRNVDRNENHDNREGR